MYDYNKMNIYLTFLALLNELNYNVIPWELPNAPTRLK